MNTNKSNSSPQRPLTSKVCKAIAALSLAVFLMTANQSVSADDHLAWFWCAAHHSSDNNARSFYSNVFRGEINARSRYERAFQSLISTRMLQVGIQGNVLCVFNKVRGEARREQNDYALDRKVRRGGTMEFLDWSY